MIDTPGIMRSEEKLTAVIHLVVPREKIQEVMGPGMSEVSSVLAAQGISAAGPWFAHHLKMDPKIFDFEIGVPVKSAVAAAGRVKPGRLPAMKVARTVSHGPYEGLFSAWGEFGAWIKAQGLKPAPHLWEVYTTDPGSNPDPSTWLTELNQPLLE